MMQQQRTSHLYSVAESALVTRPQWIDKSKSDYPAKVDRHKDEVDIANGIIKSPLKYCNYYKCSNNNCYYYYYYKRQSI